MNNQKQIEVGSYIVFCRDFYGANIRKGVINTAIDVDYHLNLVQVLGGFWIELDYASPIAI